jgi:hypothetical protein
MQSTTGFVLGLWRDGCEMPNWLKVLIALGVVVAVAGGIFLFGPEQNPRETPTVRVHAQP